MAKSVDFKPKAPDSPQEGDKTKQTAPLQGGKASIPEYRLKVSFAGRLKPYLESWQIITSNCIILSWVKGYKIPFFLHS